MDLEVREIPIQSRAMYNSRLKSYKQEVEKLEKDFVSIAYPTTLAHTLHTARKAWFTHPTTQTLPKIYSFFTNTKTPLFEGQWCLPRLILSVFMKLCWAWGVWACASPPPCPCLVIHKSYLPSKPTLLTSNLNEGLALRNCFLSCFTLLSIVFRLILIS